MWFCKLQNPIIRWPYAKGVYCQTDQNQHNLLLNVRVLYNPIDRKCVQTGVSHYINRRLMMESIFLAACTVQESYYVLGHCSFIH